MSIDFCTKIYETTSRFPNHEKFGLISQLRRSVVSIPSNIAEGSERGKNEFKQFINFALGSAAEARTQLTIAKNVNFILKSDFDALTKEIDEISKMLHGMRKKLSNN
jgi:four helix bundle protein